MGAPQVRNRFFQPFFLAVRKDAGLELTDRIRLTLPEADDDLLEHADWIARETLAVSVEASGSELSLEKS